MRTTVSFKTFWGWQLALFPEKTPLKWLFSVFRLLRAYGVFIDRSELVRWKIRQEIEGRLRRRA